MNKIINGDCLEELPDLIKEIKNDIIIVTDPPFNIDYHYKNYKDKMEDEMYYEMLGKVFSYTPFVVVHYPEEIYKIAFQVGEFPDRVVSWVYNSNTAKQHRDIAFFGVKPDFRKVGQPYKNPKDKRIAKRIKEGKSARLYDWWNVNQVKNVSKAKTEHPCQMPLKVMKNIIGVLPDNKVIVDPFAGSGTTAIACKELGRSFVMIELDKEYCEIIKDRISNHPIDHE
jgi:site-specific DNA-methyltransferase (adenine-specific)